MSVAAAFAASDHQPLARDLLARALAAFAQVAPDDRGPALLAIDRFIAAPGPATYLAATRILVDTRRAGALRQVRAAHAGHAFSRGLETVRYELGVAAAEALGAIPVDDLAGERLRALALLSTAHRELAERVAGSAELLRKKLALSAERAPPDAPPRRRPSSSRRSAPSRRRRG